jgi:surfeit locus 1 family protein
VAIVGLLALSILFASLGRWQLRRAHEVEDVAARFALAAEAPPLERAPAALTEELRFRRLAVAGNYEVERQFLLDNQVRDGVAGYEVLTPFRIAADDRWLLVNRGWVAADPDRSVLPNVVVDAVAREISGRLERLPRAGIRLGDTPAAQPRGDLVVVVYPTAQELGALAREPLLDYQLLLDDAAPDGFARGWRAPGLGPERHLGYAGQWFLFAIGAFAAGVTIAFKARSRARAGAFRET